MELAWAVVQPTVTARAINDLEPTEPNSTNRHVLRAASVDLVTVIALRGILHADVGTKIATIRVKGKVAVMSNPTIEHLVAISLGDSEVCAIAQILQCKPLHLAITAGLRLAATEVGIAGCELL